MSRYGGTEYVYSRDSSERSGGFVLFVMIVVGIVLTAFLLYYFNNSRHGVYSMVLVRDKVVQKEMVVDHTDLKAPGDSSEYTIKVNCRDAGIYTFEFAFSGDEKNALSPYVTVQLYLSEEQQQLASLASLLAGETLKLESYFAASDAANIIVRYTMSEEVGNELQGVGLDFNLKMTAKQQQVEEDVNS